MLQVREGVGGGVVLHAAREAVAGPRGGKGRAGRTHQQAGEAQRYGEHGDGEGEADHGVIGTEGDESGIHGGGRWLTRPPYRNRPKTGIGVAP